MYQVLWSASVCQLSHLPCIKYFGLPVSVSCPLIETSTTKSVSLWYWSQKDVVVVVVAVVVVVVVGWLVKRPSNMRVYLRDGSAQTILHAVTLR